MKAEDDQGVPRYYLPVRQVSTVLPRHFSETRAPESARTYTPTHLHAGVRRGGYHFLADKPNVYIRA